MRVLAVALVGFTLMACAEQRPAQRTPTTTYECYLNVSYVRDNELSRRVWDHIIEVQYDLINSGDNTFRASLWYDRGAGRAGFVYASDCEIARVSVQTALEQFARRATSPDVSQALRDAKSSVREVTQAQFEDAGPP